MGSSPGVCCVKELAMPPIPQSNPAVEQKKANIEYLNAALRELGVKAPRTTGRRDASIETRASEVGSMGGAEELRRSVLTCAEVARSRYQSFVVAKPDTLPISPQRRRQRR